MKNITKGNKNCGHTRQVNYRLITVIQDKYHLITVTQDKLSLNRQRWLLRQVRLYQCCGQSCLVYT